jgi:hypothetical protein
MTDHGFRATDQSTIGHRGFAIDFPNDYSVSVQWGWMNYCANRNIFGSHQERLESPFESKTAEVMITWRGNGLSVKRFPQGLFGRWQHSFDEFGIAANLSADSVAKLLSDVAYLTEEPL